MMEELKLKLLSFCAAAAVAVVIEPFLTFNRNFSTFFSMPSSYYFYFVILFLLVFLISSSLGCYMSKSRSNQMLIFVDVQSIIITSNNTKRSTYTPKKNQ